jgi:uncharacterized DUF497 family protein
LSGAATTVGLVAITLAALFTLRATEADMIRLISASKADKHEREDYGQV